MKKWLAVLLPLILILVLAACSSSRAEEISASVSETAEDKADMVTEPEPEPGSSNMETNSTADESRQSKILVAYFSATGNTKPIAETISSLTGGDLFEIVPADPYTDEDLNYSNDDCRANQEQNNAAARPEISGSIENIDEYDIVLLGHPIWWYVAPTIINTFLEQYDLTGKKVVPFATSGGSGMGRTNAELKNSCKGAVLAEGKRFPANAGASELKAWADSVK